MTLTIDIAVESDAWSSLADVEAVIERAITAAAEGSGLRLAPGAEVSVLLCDDTAMRALNGQWRGLDAPTNVLSFPAARPPGPKALERAPVLGDIAIAYETAAREATAQGKPLGDHVIHLAVHGTLHLLGHDHLAPAEADAMEALETTILASLGIADPYAGTPAIAGAQA